MVHHAAPLQHGDQTRDQIGFIAKEQLGLKLLCRQVCWQIEPPEDRVAIHASAKRFAPACDGLGQGVQIAAPQMPGDLRHDVRLRALRKIIDDLGAQKRGGAILNLRKLRADTGL